jgi:cold shock CspA family protein
MRGEMIFFNDEKHLGFIRTEEGERLCVRRSGFTGEAPVGRCGGMVVSFTVRETEGEREAFDVVPVAEQAHGRARRRHRGMHLG